MGFDAQPAIAMDEQSRLDRLHAEQLTALFRVYPKSALIASVVAVTVVYVLSHVMQPEPLLIWLGMFALVYGFRYFLVYDVSESDLAVEPQRYERLFLAGVVAAGIVWGSSAFLLFPTGYSDHQFFLILAVAGICAGGVTSLSYRKRHVFTFLALILPPLVIRLMLEGELVSAAEGILLVAFSVGMFQMAHMMSSYLNRTINTSIVAEDTAQSAVSDRNILELVLDTLPGGVFWKDRDGRYLGANRSFAHHVGVDSVEELIGKRETDLPAQSNVRQHEEAEALILAGRKKIIQQEEQVRVAGGFQRWLEGTWVPVRERNGSIAGLLGMYRDISKRKQAEETLRLAATAFETHEAVLVTDARGNILCTNKAFTEITGYSSNEVIGQNPRVLSSGQHDTNFYQKMWATLIADGRWEGEVINRRKNGELYPEQLTITSVKDASGDCVNYVAVFSDNTEKREMEGQLRHAQKMEAIGTLVGGIAHEFNNMLVSITGNIFLAQSKVEEKESEEEIVHHLEDASNMGFKAADMIAKLLTFSRKDEHAYQMKHIDMADWVDEAVKLSQSAIPVNYHLDVSCEEKDLKVSADTTLLQQILINLINNARDAAIAKEQPEIHIRLFSGEADQEFRNRHRDFNGYDYVCLSVSDNGCGIPEEQLSRIFEPFFTTKEVGKGTGLGLPIIQGAMRSHQGCIEIDSEVDKGTTFSLYFPRLTDISTIRDGAVEIRDDSILHGNGETILVADDEPAVLELSRLLLNSLGYKVITAADGKEAVEKVATQGPVDMVLLDVVMPVMSGPEAAQKIIEKSPDMPIAFYSGYSRSEMLVEVREYELIGKPFKVSEISQVVHRLLAQRKQGR